MAEISRKDLILALIGASTNPRIAGTDLSALDMTRLNLEGANLRGANMMACTCRETILRSTNMTGTDGTTAHMPFAAFNNATLPRTNFTDFNLNGALLADANFTNP